MWNPLSWAMEVAAILAIILLDFPDFVLILGLLVMNATISYREEASADKVRTIGAQTPKRVACHIWASRDRDAVLRMLCIPVLLLSELLSSAGLRRVKQGLNANTCRRSRPSQPLLHQKRGPSVMGSWSRLMLQSWCPGTLSSSPSEISSRLT